MLESLKAGIALAALVAAAIAGACVVAQVREASSYESSFERLGEGDTIEAVRVRETELRQILRQVEATSFDQPGSWEDELRMRRIALGSHEVLAVQGARFLCGATGNCQTWLLRRAGSQWVSLFESERLIVGGFRFEPSVHRGSEDLVVVSYLSVEEALCVAFFFDGQYYRQQSASRCNEASNGRGEMDSRA